MAPAPSPVPDPASDPAPSDRRAERPPSVDAWRDLVRAIVAPALAARTPERRVPGDAVGQVLAADVLSPRDLPAHPVSAMDGFALRRADLRALAEGAAPPRLPVADDLPAAPGEAAPLPPGSAARIMTGAPLPPGADTVIEVERTDAAEHGPAPRTVAITDLAGVDLGPGAGGSADPSGRPRLGRNVRAAGEEVARGDVLARAGDPVGAGLVGLATTLGIPELEVIPPVRVGVLVTGDELVDAADAPAAARTGAVRESNGAMLRAALAGIGVPGDRVSVRRTGDDPAAFLAQLDALAAEHDLLITSGGVGHGAYDVVKAALGEQGRGTSRFAHVALRPGGPQGVGRVAARRSEDPGTPVVHLPGTPVGALVGFHLFLRALLQTGAAGHPVLAELRDPRPAPPAHADGGRGSGRAGHRRPGIHVLPGLRGRTPEGRLAVDLLAGSRLSPYGRADALVLVEGGAPEPGAMVPILPI